MNIAVERAGEFQGNQIEAVDSRELVSQGRSRWSQGMVALSLAVSCLSIGGLSLGENVVRIINQGSLNGGTATNAGLGTAIIAFGTTEAVTAFRRFRRSNRL